MGTVLVIAVLWARHETAAPPGITLEPVRLLADGYDTATLTFHSAQRPRISIDPPYAATVENITDSTARIRAGVLPAQIRVRVEFPNSAPATFRLATSLTAADTFEDGTPDFLRLDDDRDRMAFRRWFTFLAETQYFQAPGARPAEIDDCAALIRYAYRETFRAHDAGWAEAARRAGGPGLRPAGQVSLSLHAPRRRVVPRPRRTARPRRFFERRICPIRRRPNPAPLQYPFPDARS